MNLTVAEIKPEIKQAWMSKQDAIIYFGYQNHVPTFQKLLSKFSKHKDYKDGYILATTKVPIIKIELFEEFLRWHEINKYKRNS